MASTPTMTTDTLTLDAENVHSTWAMLTLHNDDKHTELMMRLENMAWRVWFRLCLKDRPSIPIAAVPCMDCTVDNARFDHVNYHTDLVRLRIIQPLSLPAINGAESTTYTTGTSNAPGATNCHTNNPASVTRQPAMHVTSTHIHSSSAPFTMSPRIRTPLVLQSSRQHSLRRSISLTSSPPVSVTSPSLAMPSHLRIISPPSPPPTHHHLNTRKRIAIDVCIGDLDHPSNILHRPHQRPRPLTSSSPSQTTSLPQLNSSSPQQQQQRRRVSLKVRGVQIQCKDYDNNNRSSRPEVVTLRRTHRQVNLLSYFDQKSTDLLTRFDYVPIGHLNATNTIHQNTLPSSSTTTTTTLIDSEHYPRPRAYSLPHPISSSSTINSTPITPITPISFNTTNSTISSLPSPTLSCPIRSPVVTFFVGDDSDDDQ